jgi:hypothetical protein
MARLRALIQILLVLLADLLLFTVTDGATLRGPYAYDYTRSDASRDVAETSLQLTG